MLCAVINVLPRYSEKAIHVCCSLKVVSLRMKPLIAYEFYTYRDSILEILKIVIDNVVFYS